MKSDIEIAQAGQDLPVTEITKKLELNEQDLELFGSDKAKISWPAIKQAQVNQHLGKLIPVTSISPTPAGEGKSTMTTGLADALSNQLHEKALIALREPLMGPIFGLKSGAAGGGRAQAIPMEDINLRFTGDMHALTSAVDTLAALVDNYIYQDNSLKLDPNRTLLKRGLDVNDRILRKITLGQGSRFNGIKHEASFAIAVANELIAILRLVTSISDLKQCIGNILIGYSIGDDPVFIKDLHFEGAIVALLGKTLKPNLVQTIEHTPALIHGGPFANIAHGANSVMATNLALHLSDYVVTEARFGSGLGGQKFMDFVSTHLEKAPDAIIVVATVRALGYQAEQSTDNLANENLAALREGFKDLAWHMNNMHRYNRPVIALINKFDSDTEAGLNLLQDLTAEHGIDSEVVTYHNDGSLGGIKAAERVRDLTNQEQGEVMRSYAKDDTIQVKIEQIAQEIYHAGKVEYNEKALTQIEHLKELGKDKLPVIVAKTQYSFSDDKKVLGAPTNFTLHVKNLTLKNGAGFIVVSTGSILDIPGLPKHPVALDIDIDNERKISGLF